VVVGKAGQPFFVDAETGLLGQFRHQYFIVNLIAHFQKAALMLFSEWLVVAISQLDIRDLDSVRVFKREIRRIMATFLRFTERYWFHEVSDQAQIRDLFRLLTGHLNTDRIYQDVSTSVKEMNHFLDSDSQRRQANTVMRLTVVTTLGLVATVATGFLGMNLFDETNQPGWVKLLIFCIVLVPSSLLVNYAVANSKILSDFMEALADKRLTWWDRTQILLRVWREPPEKAAKP
jgi:Mg2+ and Co2+ transporter CorA